MPDIAEEPSDLIVRNDGHDFAAQAERYHLGVSSHSYRDILVEIKFNDVFWIRLREVDCRIGDRLPFEVRAYFRVLRFVIGENDLPALRGEYTDDARNCREECLFPTFLDEVRIDVPCNGCRTRLITYTMMERGWEVSADCVTATMVAEPEKSTFIDDRGDLLGKRRVEIFLVAKTIVADAKYDERLIETLYPCGRAVPLPTGSAP